MSKKKRRRTTIEMVARDRLEARDLQKRGILLAQASPVGRLPNCPKIEAIQANWQMVRVRLHYMSAPQEIRVSWTRCNYGGGRPWLHCPHCDSRRGMLFHGLGGYFCRTCLGNLRYASQTKSQSARRHFRATKIRLRLGCSAALEAELERPKGMHRKTYERFRQKLYDLERGLSPRMLRTEPDYRNLVYHSRELA